jgi:hypothetical protein
MEALFRFVEEMCAHYNIDDSHGILHAKGTAARAQAILQTLPNVSPSEQQMAIYAAALHDTCDHKYTDVEEAANKIDNWLQEVGWSPEHSAALIGIITTMSYSQLKKQQEPGMPLVFPDHGVWQRAYHVARSADILESYIVARCVFYDRHIYPEDTEVQHWERASQLFNDRVFRYRIDGWLTIPAAVDMSFVLEKEARRCLDEHSLSWPLVDL